MRVTRVSCIVVMSVVGGCASSATERRIDHNKYPQEYLDAKRFEYNLYKNNHAIQVSSLYERLGPADIVIDNWHAWDFSNGISFDAYTKGGGEVYATSFRHSIGWVGPDLPPTWSAAEDGQ